MHMFRLAVWIPLLLGPLSAAEYHVSPTGTPQGDGSVERPWDVGTAFAPPAVVQPGDTVWLHGGTYRGGFTSKLAGTPEQPVVVRGVPGARVTFDTAPRDARDNCLLHFGGDDAIYRDFEVTSSEPKRETKIAGSWPEDIRRGAVDIRGSRVKAINLVVHDLGSGFGFWSEAEGGEVSGCLVYNNGWRGPDRGHGHAIYAQNARGTKRIADNILFHQFAYGIHVYGSEKASLRGFDIEGNIAFENGCLTRIGDNAAGILVGGGCPVSRTTIRDNVAVNGGIRVGYTWGQTNEDIVLTGNYAEGGLVVRDFQKATVAQNTIVAASSVVILEGAAKLLLAGHTWKENEYYVTDGRWGECAIVENSKSRGLTFEELRQTTGLDAGSKFTKGQPTKLRVFVRPNQYEPGRGHIAVVNPAGLPEVDVDLSGVLKPGQPFRIVSAKDFYGKPLVTGKFAGEPIKLQMTKVTPPPPVGLPKAELPTTEPHFGAFVVLGD